MVVARYDVDAVRACFPALRSGVAHFDGPGGSQVPEGVGRAVADTLVSGIANRGRVTAAERVADDVVLAARQAIADLLAVGPDTVVFGRSMTALTYEASRALARTWAPGDEVVVSRLDHDANIRPWVQAAEAVRATVRVADFDPATGELRPDDVAAVLSPRTRLVAVTGASNLIGTRPPVAAIADLAHDVGALVAVDGVHLTAHVAVDVSATGADLFTCSPYKFLGPHCGVLTGRPELLAALHPDKLLPSSEAVPERFELGTLPYELLAGTTAAVDFLASLAELAGRAESAGRADVAGRAESAGGEPASGDRRARLVRSMTAVQAHEDRLRRRLEDGLADHHRVTIWSRAPSRTPTVLFAVDGHSSQDVYRHLAARNVNAPAGSFYALEASRRLGLGDGGAVRAGLAPYSSDDDVDRLLAGLADLRR